MHGEILISFPSNDWADFSIYSDAVRVSDGNLLHNKPVTILVYTQLVKRSKSRVKSLAQGNNMHALRGFEVTNLGS